MVYLQIESVVGLVGLFYVFNSKFCYNLNVRCGSIFEPRKSLVKKMGSC